jgi:hypothetical protein
VHSDVTAHLQAVFNKKYAKLMMERMPLSAVHSKAL